MSLAFKYTFTSVINTEMTNLATIDVNQPFASVKTYGDLKLRQASPMYTPSGFYKLNYLENPIASMTNQTIPNLLEEYSKRNGKLILVHLDRDYEIRILESHQPIRRDKQTGN